MTLLYKHPRIGDLQVHDTHGLANKRAMLADFNRISKPNTMHQICWQVGERDKLELDQTQTNFKPLIEKPLFTILDFVLKERVGRIGQGDRLRVVYQRRVRSPYSNFMIPRLHDIDSDHHAILCVNTTNARSNMYTLAGKSEQITKELSPGYMLSLKHAKGLRVMPSSLDAEDFHDDSIEDAMIISYYISKNQ